jgi:hypothetical protein
MACTSDNQREVAVGLVANNELSDREIVDRIGVSRRTLLTWRGMPEFLARVQETVKASSETVIKHAIAVVENESARQIRSARSCWRSSQEGVRSRATLRAAARQDWAHFRRYTP